MNKINKKYKIIIDNVSIRHYNVIKDVAKRHSTGGDAMRNKLRRIRLEKGLTHEKIAELVGISRATYTNIELGHKNPSFKVAARIKKILDYEKDDIFLETECQKDTNKTA